MLMFSPVSPNNLYHTEAGTLLLESVIKASNDPLHIFTDRSVHYPGERYPVDDCQAQARLDVCAAWLTGNYDPVTNTHILYRGIDDAMLADFREHGALTSRLVKVFGNNDPKLAEKTLRKAARGKIPRHLRDNVEAAVAASEITNIQRGYQKNHALTAAQELLRGKPSEATRQTLMQRADLLETVAKGGRAAYLAAVKEADTDLTTPSVVGSLPALTHSSIHLTSDPEFIKDRQQIGWFSHTVKLNFVPGSLPVAPNVGIIDNRLILPSGSISFDEREWYGVGQLKPKPGQVSIQLDPSLSLEHIPYDSGDDF
jgi:hypothetical protein